MSPRGIQHERPRQQRDSRARTDQEPVRGGRPQHPQHAGEPGTPESSDEDRAFQRDEIVRDTRKGRIGVVMDKVGPRYQLRPPDGGREWEAGPADMERAPAPDRMKAKLAEANALSRRRGGSIL